MKTSMIEKKLEELERKQTYEIQELKAEFIKRSKFAKRFPRRKTMTRKIRNRPCKKPRALESGHARSIGMQGLKDSSANSFL